MDNDGDRLVVSTAEAVTIEEVALGDSECVGAEERGSEPVPNAQ